jgi:hypothetical protein
MSDSLIKTIVQTCTLTRDSLPYTKEFEKLYKAFRAGSEIPLTKSQFWQEILRIVKKGGWKGKQRGVPAPKISNPQIMILWEVMNYRTSDCDKLVYTNKFDAILVEFNSRTGLHLYAHELWKLMSNSRKAKAKREMIMHLEKAKEVACLAVEVYNKPLVKFRSGNYVVLMNIAWTSLFHSIFFQRGIKPFYRTQSGRYLRIDGDYKAWELTQCLKEYYGGNNPPLRKNLEFFVGLRNRIEHRSLPELDLRIFGECQAMLFNFETTMTQAFGEDHGLGVNLGLALQFSHSVWKEQSAAIQRLHKPLLQNVQEYIDRFRSSLGNDTLASLQYAYKFFLIPKVGNHHAQDTVAIEFVKYDPNDPEKMKEYEHLVAMVKPRYMPAANVGTMPAGQVCKRILPSLQKLYGDDVKFSPSSHHVRAWKYYKIRPKSHAQDPARTDPKYCLYDSAHKDYIYTEAWVLFLLKEFSDKDKFKDVMRFRG